MTILLTGLKYFFATIFLFASYGASYQYIGTVLDEQKYLPIGKMIDVGGYKLHMVDQGFGGPTVVIDAGAGCNCLDWSLVQPEIAKFTRVITYDRAGYAWSEASPLDRTSENIVEELRTLLFNAQIPGPYLLVGHSFGGNNMRLYATKYPEEVVGVVLVDSAHEDLLDFVPLPGIEYFQLLMGFFYLGIFRLLTNVSSIQNSLDEHIKDLPLPVRKIYYAQRMTTKFATAVRAEAFFAQESCKQLQQSGRSLGDIPLTVITAGKPLMAHDHLRVKGIYTSDQVDAINKGWSELQIDLVTKSSCAKHIFAENSGHMICFEQPEIIVEMVREMIVELNQAN